MSELVSFVTPVHTCGVCGANFSHNEWQALKCKGCVGAYKSGGKLRAVELRDCGCGNTMTMEVDVPPKTELRRSWVR